MAQSMPVGEKTSNSRKTVHGQEKTISRPGKTGVEPGKPVLGQENRCWSRKTGVRPGKQVLGQENSIMAGKTVRSRETM